MLKNLKYFNYLVVISELFKVLIFLILDELKLYDDLILVFLEKCLKLKLLIGVSVILVNLIYG